MAQVTEDVCRRIIEDTERGYSTGLTQWERCQLAWAWLKLNGHEVPEHISSYYPKGRPAQETSSAPKEQVECPNCFGEGAIAMSTGYERRICELCQGSGKTLVRRCARCKVLLHILNTSDTCSDCSL